MFENAYNYISEKNNVSISFCTSQSKGCPSKNILSDNQKSIWLSEKNVPQTIIINLSRMIKSPNNYFKYFGIYCWHAYTTNPKTIQISFSENNNKYFLIGEFELNMSPSPQFFQIDNITIKKNIKKIKFLKLIIKETFGGNRTYINQIFLYDDTIDINYNYSLSNYEENLNESDDDYNNNFKPISPSKEVKKYYNTNPKNSLKESLKKKSKKNYDLLNDELKEKKLKKIEKILKSKILNNITEKKEKETINNEKEEQLNINKYITPENEKEEEEENLNYQNVNLNDYLSDENSKIQSISSHPRNKIYNVSNLMSGNQTESEDPFKTNNFNSHSNSTYSTNPNKRNLTPIPKSSKPYFKSPINKNDISISNRNNNDKKICFSKNENSDYKRLEDQLKQMEEQLKLLEPNYDMGKNLSHSKSFSFLPNESNKILSTPYNPFINQNNNNTINQNNNNTINNNNINTINQNNINTINNNNTNINFTNENNQFNSISLKKGELIIPNKDIEDNLNSLNSNGGNLYEDRLKVLENKMNNIENEIIDMKNQFNKLSNDIQILISKKESNNNNNQIIQIVLNECEKLINLKLNEFNYQLNNQYHQSMNRTSHEYYSNNNINYNSISLDSDLNSLELRLNKKIDEKLNILANNIQSQINDNLLRPSIKSIEKTMKNNMEEIKDKLIQLNLNTNNNNNFNQSEGTSFVDSYRISKSLFTSQNDNKSSSVKRNEKFEEINKIGEKLYDKLVEKEKKLQEFKNETTNYLKRKLKNDERKFTNSINSLNSQSNNIN